MASSRPRIGVDLGGTTFTVAAVDEMGRILTAADDETRAADGAEAVIGRIKRAVERVLEETGGAAGIGLGIPGLIDRERALSLMSPNLGWRNVPVGSAFTEAFGLPVGVDNDVRCAALGEKHYGAGRGVDNLVLITLGTGIGSGIFLDGKLWRGPGGFAGEVGHQTVAPDGPSCGCGNHGCVEAVAAGPAIARRGRDLLQRGEAPRLAELCGGRPERVTPAVLYQAAQAGDRAAAAVFEDAGRLIGIAMANVVNVLNPERIIVGGGVMQAGDLILAPIRREIERRAMTAAARMVDVVPAALGPRAGVIGASTLAPAAAGAWERPA